MLADGHWPNACTVTLDPRQTFQTTHGFGGCSNEAGRHRGRRFMILLGAIIGAIGVAWTGRDLRRKDG